MMNNNEISREVFLELSPSSLPSSHSAAAPEIRRRRRRQSNVYYSNKNKSRLVETVYPKIKSENLNVTGTLGSSAGGDDDVWGNDDDDDYKVHVDDKDDDDDDDVYMTSSGGGGGVDDDEKKHGKNNVIVKLLILMEWFTLFCMVGLLIPSLCIHKLKYSYIWGLNIWKWCILILVVFCGHLVTKWFIHLLEFSIGRNFLFKKKVLYFIYGVKTSVRVFIWLGLILLTWVLLTNHTRSSRRVLNYISRGIGCCLLGAFCWMIKDFLIKLLASTFHVKTFFDRIQDSIFHQYVLQVLYSSSSLQNRLDAINIDHNDKGTLKINKSSNKNKNKNKKLGKREEIIRVDKLSKVKKEKVSSWTMGGLIKTISSSGLSVISDKEITSEFDAKLAAKHIFKKVAKTSNE